MGQNLFKAILFDFGNTLFPFREQELDYVDEKTFRYLEKHLGRLDFEKFKEARNKTKERPYQLPPTFIENKIEDVIRDILTPFTSSEEILIPLLNYRRQMFIEVAQMPPDLPGILRNLSRKFKLAVVSNYPDAYPILEILNKFKLTKYFKTIIISGEVGYVKPSPIIFQTALQKLQVEPQDSLFVGDNWYMDIWGAQQLGMTTAYIKQWLKKEDFEEGLKNSKPHFVIETLKDLEKIVLRKREKNVPSFRG
jgi:HAD superfamily hydrolase (TIGR01509 family)